MIPVHGGEFGNSTEASLSAIMDSVFGEGASAALAELAVEKGKAIVAERARVAKEEAAKVAKEEKAAEHAAAHPHKHESK